MNLIAKSNPLAPVFLPEFGHPVSWAMCRNPSCANFGIHYEGPPPGDRGVVTDARYRIEAKTGRFRCKVCEQSFALKSNRAIRPLARYFLGPTPQGSPGPREGAPASCRRCSGRRR